MHLTPASAALAVLVSLCAASAAAADLHVPQTFATIQSALDSAPPGATIVVAPGTYRENLLILKPVTLRSTGGAAQTVVDGQRLGPVVVAYGSGQEAVQITGFTLTNGLNRFGIAIPFGAGGAGGVVLESVSATVTDNVIRANVGCLGTGVSTVTAALDLRRNHILDNPQDPVCGGADGGGVFLRGDGATPPVVASNWIAGHRVSGSGAGVALQGVAGAVIRDNVISDNEARDGGVGGGILINVSDATVTGNLLSGNAASSGGGLAAFPDTPQRVRVSGNLFRGNRAISSGSAVTISVYAQESMQFFDNIVLGRSEATLIQCDAPYAVSMRNLLINSAGPVWNSGFCVAQ
jgi:Right handed beta helix region/Protein of unknown function (DUF1565)